MRPARRRRFHANVQSRVMTLLGFELQRSQPLGGEDGDGDEHALLGECDAISSHWQHMSRVAEDAPCTCRVDVNSKRLKRCTFI